MNKTIPHINLASLALHDIKLGMEGVPLGDPRLKHFKLDTEKRQLKASKLRKFKALAIEVQPLATGLPGI